MDPLINRRIYDSDDENWKENRKKSLHDPMNLQKDSNKDSGETSKSKVVKIQQKRKKKQQTLLLGLHCLGLVFWYLKLFVKLVKILRNLVCLPIHLNKCV